MSQVGLPYIRVNLYIITNDESLISGMHLAKGLMKSATFYYARDSLKKIK